MLTRIYIDNFRSFVNFEYRPGRKQLILGDNGSGKSSLLDALLMIRQFAIVGDFGMGPSPLSQRTRWMDQPQQTWELEAVLGGNTYVYRFIIDSWGDPPRPRVISQTVHFDGEPVFEFVGGEVHLYNDFKEHIVKYPFDWHRSALATITPQMDNQKLIGFMRWLDGLLCFRINPFAMGVRAEKEDYFPNVDLSNIAPWYRHLLQAYPKQNAGLLENLRSALDGFSFLKLASAGENIRLLVAEFESAGRTSTSFRFDELSEGQRCLICLYTILHFVVENGGTVILDEPENFIALREIQPWLMAVSDAADDHNGQVLLISHHPELMNQWAPDFGVRFVREGIGPVRVEEFRGESGSTLAPAELIARGW